MEWKVRCYQDVCFCSTILTVLVVDTVDSVLTPASVVASDPDLIGSGVLAEKNPSITEENCVKIKEPEVDIRIYTESNSYVAYVQILPSNEAAVGKFQT